MTETTLRRRVDWRQNIIYIGFILVFAVFAFTLYDRGFLGVNNLLNIVRQSAMIAIMAVAVTFVLSAGEIDLSVGAVAGLASVTTALGIAEWGLVPGVAIGIGTGFLVGAINGTLTTIVGIPSFLVTLAMLGIARGAAMWISDTASIPILNDSYTFLFGSGDIGPIPILLIWTVLAAVVGHIALRKTRYGRQVLATGGNVTAARFSGIATGRMKFYVLLGSSMTAGFAGMLYAGRLHTGRFQFGEGDELSVIAACVLGGTSLFGGFGTVIGSIIGALMISLINNGLIFMGLDFSQQLIARGVIILLAVGLARKQS